MRTLEMTATVGLDRTVTLQLPPDIMPGEYQIVIVIDDSVRSRWPPMPIADVPPRVPPRRTRTSPPDVTCNDDEQSP